MGKCTTTKRSEQILEACHAFFGETHCRIATFADDDTGDQDGSYFDLNGIVINSDGDDYEEKQYYVLLSNGGETVDPEPEGKTKIEVTYTDNDDDATIAGLVKTALEALVEDPFVVEIEDGTLHIENKFIGAITEETATGAGDIEVELGRAGFGGSLGAFAEGGATLSTESDVLDVTSDQTGAIVLDQLLRGTNLSLEATLVEMTEQRWIDLIGKVRGDIKTVGEKKLVGWGTSKINQSLFQYSGKIVLHPVRLPLSNRDSDIMIWKSAPNMNSINFSGSDIQGGEFEFNSYQDKTKDKKVDLGMRGDWTLAL